jgi:hypothetical protein
MRDKVFNPFILSKDSGNLSSFQEVEFVAFVRTCIQDGENTKTFTNDTEVYIPVKLEKVIK